MGKYNAEKSRMDGEALLKHRADIEKIILDFLPKQNMNPYLRNNLLVLVGQLANYTYSQNEARYRFCEPVEAVWSEDITNMGEGVALVAGCPSCDNTPTYNELNCPYCSQPLIYKE